jgi:autotransporter-associated beta strand protein
VFRRARWGVSAAALLWASAAAAQVFQSQGPAPRFGPIPNVQTADQPPNGSEGGAIQAILLDPALGPNTMFIGSTNGGVFITKDGGTTWKALTDRQSSLSIASLGLDPMDPSGNTIVAGLGLTSNGIWSLNTVVSGRGGPRNGLLYSTDGGSNWTQLGTADLRGQTVIGVAARGSTILAATFEPQNATVMSAPGGQYGLYLSTDRGMSFNRVAALPGPVTSLVADPTDPSKFYAAVTRSDAGHLNETAVYMSTNTGATWTPVFTQANSNGTINGSAQTVLQLATGPNGAVAIAVSDITGKTFSGLFLSQNYGGSWQQLTTAPNVVPGGQVPVNLHVAIDPTNTNIVYLSGDAYQTCDDSPPTSMCSIKVFRVQRTSNTTSTATSLTFEGTAALHFFDANTVHADSRDMVVDSSGRLLLSSDGGIYARNNPQGNGSWQGLNGNLSAFEPYTALFDANSKRIVVAAQDNGTSFQTAPGSNVFNGINFGDGVSVAINDRTMAGMSAIYSSSNGIFGLSRFVVDAQGTVVSPLVAGNPGGVFISCHLSGQPADDCSNVISGAGVTFGAIFTTNRIDPSRIVFGGTNVYTTQDPLSNVTTATGVNLLLTDLGTTGQVTAMSYGATNNVHALVVGTNNSQLYRSLSQGGAVEQLTNYAGEIPTSIVIDNRASRRYFVADAVSLWGTTNGAAAAGSVTFQDLTPNLAPLGFIRPSGLEFISANGVNALLVGGLNTPLVCNPTPGGCVISSTQSPITVADSDSSGNLTGWRAFGQELPNALVYQMAYNPAVDVLVASSVGRGVFLAYDVTSNFKQASVLQFGLADNNSNPDASILTDGTALDGTQFVRPLIKYGIGTLTIAGNASYTGPTTVSAGILDVNGSIASSSLVTVNAGATLAGNGTVGPTSILAGGTLSPGNSVGTLTVAGSLAFASGSLYMVEVQGSSADRVNASGAATLAGTIGVVNLGSTFAHSYTILSAAGGRSGTFDNVASIGLPGFLSASLSYTSTDAILNLNSGIGQIAGLTVNQSKVAAALDNSFNNGGGTLPALLTLPQSQLPAALNMLSGEGVSGTQETAFGAAVMFNSIMMDQGAFWRSGDAADVNGVTFSGEQLLSYATAKKRLADNPVFKAMPAPWQPRWRAWLTGFDGTAKLAGDAATGSAALSHNVGGLAGGLDYQWAPDMLLGFALGGSSSNFSVNDRITSGHLEAAHFGGYGVKTWSHFYLAGALSFSTFRNTTSRTIAGVGPTETATGSFGSNLLSGRLEVGSKQVFGRFAVTPFAAVQFAELWQNGFTETNTVPVGAPGPLGLSFGASRTSSLPTFLGAQFDTRIALPYGMVLAPYSRLSWVHEFNPTRDVTPVFIALPGAAFTVDGPRAARDAARIDAGAKLAIKPNAWLFGSFDGEFSHLSQSYAGKGGARFTW